MFLEFLFKLDSRFVSMTREHLLYSLLAWNGYVLLKVQIVLKLILLARENVRCFYGTRKIFSLHDRKKKGLIILLLCGIE